MNIFVLGDTPEACAIDQCDKHVVKMVLETAQLLCSVFPEGEAPYKRTHYNHPCGVWTRASSANYEWLLEHGDALCAEYTRRYGKRHKSQDVIEWCRDNYGGVQFEHNELTEHPQCMPDEYKHASVVEAYRRYYIEDKAYMAEWNHTRSPGWWRYGMYAKEQAHELV